MRRTTPQFYRLDDASAERVLDEVVAAVRQWREVAVRMGIPRSECEQMAPAFWAVQA